MIKKHIVKAAFIASLAFAICFGIYYAYLLQSNFADCTRGRVGGGDIGGPFTLIDERGNAVTDVDVISGPSLVYFGYTFCPDVCPMDAVRNADAVDILEELGFEVTPVFITIDPERDTPEVMADFARNIHPSMIGLSGSATQVQEALKAFKVYANKRDSGDEYYLVDHSSLTYLMMPGTVFLDFFANNIPAEKVAEKTACYLEKWDDQL